MEAIRKIQTVENGEIYLQLSEQFWGQEVEIIVLPSQPQTIPTVVAPKNSLRGCLRRYAQPNLVEKEQDIWQVAVSDKHGHR